MSDTPTFDDLTDLFDKFGEDLATLLEPHFKEKADQIQQLQSKLEQSRKVCDEMAGALELAEMVVIGLDLFKVADGIRIGESQEATKAALATYNESKGDV